MTAPGNYKKIEEPKEVQTRKDERLAPAETGAKMKPRLFIEQFGQSLCQAIAPQLSIFGDDLTFPIK
jgi:hypothetical protein